MKKFKSLKMYTNMKCDFVCNMSGKFNIVLGWRFDIMWHNGSHIFPQIYTKFNRYWFKELFFIRMYNKYVYRRTEYLLCKIFFLEFLLLNK